MSKVEHKIIVLNEINKCKDILFGSNPRSTMEIKADTWKRILVQCKSFGLVPRDKDFKYVRDVFWSNLKRSTLAKINFTKQTGRIHRRLNNIDSIVIDIIGESSRILKGIQIQDMFDDIKGTSPKFEETTNNEQFSNEYENDPISLEGVFNEANSMKQEVFNCAFDSNEAKDSESDGNKRHGNFEDSNELKKQKLKLEIQHLELQNYKAQLELVELERKLKLFPSKYTSNFRIN